MSAMMSTIRGPDPTQAWDWGRIDARVQSSDMAVIDRHRRVASTWLIRRCARRIEWTGRSDGPELHLNVVSISRNGNGSGRGPKVESGSLSDRLPPQHLEAERGVLGSILLDNEVMHDIVVFLRAEDFYRDAHQVIYAAIRELYDKNKGIDAVTLAEELKLRGQFEQVGGDDTLTEIVTSVPHAANGKYYAEIVKQKATNRQLIESATEIIRDGYSNQFTAQELLESAERKIFSIAEDQIRGETLELKDVVKQAMEVIAVRADSGGHAVTGLATGLIDLDDITGGFHPGQLIIVAARPSMGKTALALNICDHAGINLKVPVLFVSLEMGYLRRSANAFCVRAPGSTAINSGQAWAWECEQLTQLSKAYQRAEQERRRSTSTTRRRGT